jgi:hypothetical protein
VFWRRKKSTEQSADPRNLTQWWLTKFSEEERVHIETKLIGFVAYSFANTLAKYDKESSHEGTFRSLSFLSMHFERKDRVPLGLKILEKAKDFEASVIDWHFYYSHYIELRYKQRDDDPRALDDVIEACQKMIALSPDVISAWQQEDLERRVRSVEMWGKDETGNPLGLPGHKGYKQLIIIRKKQKDVAEAKRLELEYAEVWK